MRNNQNRINDIQNKIKNLESSEKTLSTRLSKLEIISDVTSGISIGAASTAAVLETVSAVPLMFRITAIVIPATIVCAISSAVNKLVFKKSKTRIKDLENILNEWQNLKLAFNNAMID